MKRKFSIDRVSCPSCSRTNELATTASLSDYSLKCSHCGAPLQVAARTATG